jgi:hypothetical protein
MENIITNIVVYSIIIYIFVVMKSEKQLRVLETKGRYKVVNGRLWTKFKGEWKEHTACVVDGYRQHILFNGRGWGKVVAYEHEIVWLYENGVYDPSMVIDHKNRIRDDNRLENLRVVTPTENRANSPNSVRRKDYFVTPNQVKSVLENYCNGANKAESARLAGVERLSGLYYINKFLKDGRLRYLFPEDSERFRIKLGLKEPKRCVL